MMIHIMALTLIALSKTSQLTMKKKEKTKKKEKRKKEEKTRHNRQAQRREITNFDKKCKGKKQKKKNWGNRGQVEGEADRKTDIY